VTLAITNPATGAAIKVWDTGGGTYSDKVAYDLTNNAWRYLNTTTGWTTSSSVPQVQLTDLQMTLGVVNATCINVTACPQELQWDKNFLIKEPALTESGRTKAFQIAVDYNYGSNGYARFAANTTAQLGRGTDANYLIYGSQLLSVDNDTIDNVHVFALAYGGTTPKARTAFTSSYGTKLVSADQTQIVLDVPKAQNYADVLFGREAGTAGSTVSAVSKSPIQITFDVAKLDTEISDASKMTTDMVIMGGPAVNQLAATLLGKTYPTHGADSGIPENAALVKVFQNAFSSGKVAVLIAGWDAPQTDLAVAAIQAGKVTNAVPAVSISGTAAAPSITTAA
jgi:hypothetical protein